ncbi:Cytochrome c55X [Gammaproteobacteria bacterium]
MKFTIFPLFILLAAPVHALPDTARQGELLHLLRHDCGACHGMTLRGGLGPALTVERMAALPAETLRFTIMEGRRGTAMPPWRGLLTEDEVAWLVDQLRAGVNDGR